MSDVDCPYCGKGQEICHDDGFGYEEDVAHEDQCYYCEKYFTFQTSIIFYYSASKADCLNGAEHKYEPTHTYPVRGTKMRCADCDDTRIPTDNEMAAIVEVRNARTGH